jgi:hypothetical protein
MEQGRALLFRSNRVEKIEYLRWAAANRDDVRALSAAGSHTVVRLDFRDPQPQDVVHLARTVPAMTVGGLGHGASVKWPIAE